MKTVLSRLFGFLKYILLIVSFGLVFYGMMKTFSRLDKPLSDGLEIFIPYAIVLVVFLLNIITSSKSVRDNLLFNFVSCFVFVIIIIVCLRSMFDKSMLLYYKYGIDFNSAYFADNLSAVKFMLYMIAGSDLLILINGFLNKEEKNKTVEKNGVRKHNFYFADEIDNNYKEESKNREEDSEKNKEEEKTKKRGRQS